MDSQRPIKNLNVETKKNSNTIAKYKDSFVESQKQLQSLKTKLEESNTQKKAVKIISVKTESERLEKNQNLKIIETERDTLIAQLKPLLEKETPPPLISNSLQRRNSLFPFISNS